MDSTTGPVFVNCEGVECHVLCLLHGVPEWQEGTVAIYMTLDLKVTFNPNKPANLTKGETNISGYTLIDFVLECLYFYNETINISLLLSI